jgi:hypothetical protein
MDLLNYALWIKIATNIILMFSLTVIILSVNKVGLLEYLYKPLNRLTDSRIIMFAWFFISTFLSAFTLDLTLAFVLLPIAVMYAEFRDLSKVEILLATTWGNIVGSEWTYFGGGDTIIGWSLLEKYLNKPLDMQTWASLFWAPTFLGLLATAVCLFFFLKSEPVESKTMRLPALTPAMGVCTLASVLGVVGLLLSYPWYITFISAIVCGIFARLSKSEYKRMPFRGLYVWTICILLGSALSSVIKANFTFTVPSYIYSLLGIITVLFLVILIHLGVTSSGATTILLPLVMASQFVDTIWLYILITKAISISYLTIFSNSCIAVGSSYGLTQKYIFKKGILVTIIQVIIFALYFYIMRGHITL